MESHLRGAEALQYVETRLGFVDSFRKLRYVEISFHSGLFDSGWHLSPGCNRADRAGAG